MEMWDTSRSLGAFTAEHDAWWAAARAAHGDAAGTRALIEVLLHRLGEAAGGCTGPGRQEVAG
jgi:hypothetical protein